MGLTVDVVTVGSLARVVVVGELDLAHVAALNEALGLACAADAPEVAVDLHAVDFLDSTAVNVLIRCFMRLRDTGRGFRIDGAGPQAVSLFRLTRLDQLLRVSARRPDAGDPPGLSPAPARTPR